MVRDLYAFGEPDNPRVWLPFSRVTQFVFGDYNYTINAGQVVIERRDRRGIRRNEEIEVLMYVSTPKPLKVDDKGRALIRVVAVADLPLGPFPEPLP